MTSAQIQAFLDQKIGRCSSSDCINILRTNISSRAARVSDTTGNVVCKAFTGGTNLLVSEVIYRSQVACGISAKVILATLQKEQGLVTSKDPSPHNLNYAMGQACPDTAPCDPAFKGVGVQILAGTTQLKTYKAARFGRQPGTHNILYNPSSSCGTKRVEVKNYATAALYNYTPYTPNAAALEKLYGTGNSCSSYGNRNFWRDYTDWFGSTHANSVSTIDTVGHLVALDGSGEMWAYPSNGKSGWLPRVSLGSPWAGVAHMVAPGDLDGDGHRDLITVDTAGKPSFHAGDGALGYGGALTMNAEWSGAKLITAAGDFSGDGIPDIFTTTASGDLMLWRGTGHASFRPAIKVGKGWQGMDLLAGGNDLNGDGKPDLLARQMDGKLFLYPGTGTSAFQARLEIGQGWGGMTRLFMPGDFTGDGRVDVLAMTSTGAMRLYKGIGAGRISGVGQIGSGWHNLAAIADAGPRATGQRVPQPGAGDVDDDGMRDYLAVTSAGELRLYRGNGTGNVSGVANIPQTVSAGSRLVPLGDFNADGVADLGIIDPAGIFWFLAGNGAGGYRSPVQIGQGWQGMDAVIGGVDFDGDRKLDVLARDSASNLQLYRGNGNGSWVGGRSQVGHGWGDMNALFSVGDFDGDQRPDIAARRTDGALILYSTNGVGGWKSAKQIGHGWQGFTSIFSPGDFDRSGSTDVLARRSDGMLVMYRGNGKGGWGTTYTLGPGWNGMTWIG